MSTQAWDGPFVVKHQTSSESARKRKKVNKIKKAHAHWQIVDWALYKYFIIIIIINIIIFIITK